MPNKRTDQSHYSDIICGDFGIKKALKNFCLCTVKFIFLGTSNMVLLLAMCWCHYSSHSFWWGSCRSSCKSRLPTRLWKALNVVVSHDPLAPMYNRDLDLVFVVKIRQHSYNLLLKKNGCARLVADVFGVKKLLRHTK